MVLVLARVLAIALLLPHQRPPRRILTVQVLLQQEQQHKLNVTRARIVQEAPAFVPLQLVVRAPPLQALLAAPQMEPQRVTRAVPTRSLHFRDFRVTAIARRVHHVQLATRLL